MRILYFSVFDKAVGAYLPPFAARSKAEAMRSFADAVNDEKHQFFKHVLDYTLMHVGGFDDESGLFSVLDPERVISGSECMADPFTAEKRVGGNGLAPEGR